ncbi:MAG: NAD-dependent epimerase/dehydratase family protein, partial [Myxococcota bacterium]
TGGAGFIGSHVAEALVEGGHEVVVLDDLSSGHRSNVPEGARLVEASITSDAASATVNEFGPDAIFHHAAQMDVRRSVADPVFDATTNVIGTVRLLEAARTAGCGFFQLASTGGAIYGEHDALPTPEDTPPRSESPYGLSKLCGEHYVDYYSRIGAFRGVSLRYGNVYGPRQDPHGEAGVVAIFSERMLRDETPTIFGDGKQTRDYVYVGDVVRAVLAAWTTEAASGPFNIGTGVETDVNRLAGVIAAAAGYTGEIPHGAAKPGEQRASCIDISRAGAVLDWRPRVSLEDGLGRTVEWFRQKGS